MKTLEYLTTCALCLLLGYAVLNQDIIQPAIDVLDLIVESIQLSNNLTAI